MTTNQQDAAFAAKTTTPDLPPCNAHCETQWPRNVGMPHAVAELTEATFGAITIAHLLEADSNITDRRKGSDDPDSEPLPFTANVVGGLHYALNACLHHIEDITDRLAQCDVRHPVSKGR